MDEFTMEVVNIINKEASKRAEKMFRQKLNLLVVNLAKGLSVEQIACYTQLSHDEVQEILQKNSDYYREWCNIYKCWCNEVDEHTENQYACNMECLVCRDCFKKEKIEQMIK